MPTIPETFLRGTTAERVTLLRSLPDERAALERAFGEWAHEGQEAPDGD